MASLDDPAATLHHCDIAVVFPSAARASMAKRVLEVDEELQPTRVGKQFSLDGATMRVDFVACDPKVLRVALSSFYDMLAVTLKTMHEFDDDANDESRGAAQAAAGGAGAAAANGTS